MTSTTAQFIPPGRSLPTRTRAAMLYGARDLRTTEMDIPALGDDDVLVQVAAVGVCGSDMHYYDAGRNGQNILRRPTVLGHEAAGVVVAKGPAAAVPVGTRVAIEPAVGCGNCPTCRLGAYNICPTGTCFGSPPTHGTMTEYLVAPSRAAHPLPDTIDTITGSMIEPLAVAVWAVQRAQVAVGHRLLITGAGPIGLLVTQVARAAGAVEITVTDINDDRLAVAAQLGATRTINTARTPLDERPVHDRVIECTGNAAVLWSAIRTVTPHGRVTVVGQAQPSVDGLPLAVLQRFEIDLVTAFRYAHAFPTAIALVESGAVDIERIITGRFTLDQAAEAVQAPVTDPRHLKVVVIP
ncbi:L-iditol 2-dehydrogenase [Nakamurella panacisegetis]|uniref:L-iditol 2-dehydrogenase n=1 Tax=Nakamurella panacisegetis TaxID=1090615 RepID=A0A1H0IRY7_9ACTN|nr:NAD(P)-dependent alcohol dehydrogenase [Nakamurella panacisegetis]SDO34227.1 L-iditol 2-dehydrogenase [Nakamurella panacisegetis]